jgi:hypothetical protein
VVFAAVGSLALLLGRARRLVLVRRLGLRLVVLVYVVVEGRLIVAACGVRRGAWRRLEDGRGKVEQAYRGSWSSSP